MNQFPLLLTRGQLREFLADHGISHHAMKNLIVGGLIKKKFLPEVITSARKRKVKPKKLRALYSLAQVRRDILAPMLES